MKTVFSISLTLALALAVSASSLAQDKTETKFFDMEKCTVCKCMKGMDMTKVKWENHAIDNGMLTMTIVPEDMKDQWTTCEKNMHSMISKVETGAAVELCGFCTTFGKLMEQGAKKKELETAAGKIMLITSDDPAVVKQIHALVGQITAEHKKMMEMMKKGVMKDQDG